MVNVGGSFGPMVAGPAPRHLVGLRLHGGRGGDRPDAADHDLLLRGAPAADRGRDPRAEVPGHRGGPLRRASSPPSWCCWASSSGCPFWAFFNLCALYVDSDLDTARLYEALSRCLRRGARRASLAPGRGRRAPGPGGGDLPHRLRHHAAPGVRLAATWRRRRPCPRSWSAWVVAALGVLRPGLRGGLHRGARLPGHLPLRGRGDGGVAPHPGVHHLDRPQGEGGPLHGLELPRGGDRRRDERRHLHDALRLREGPRAPRVRVVRARRALRPRHRRPERVREALRRVPRAGGLTPQLAVGGRARPPPWAAPAAREGPRRAAGSRERRGCRRSGGRLGRDRAVDHHVDRAEDALHVTS